MRKIVGTSLIMLLFAWSFGGVQSAARRVLVEVRDTQGKPIDKVTITVTDTERRDFKQGYATNKKGQAAFLLPLEIRVAVFLLEKEGYQNHQETIALKAVQASKEEMFYAIPFVLYRLTELTPDEKRQAEEANKKALDFFNKGIELFTAGRFVEAVSQFEGAVGAKPDFLEAFENLAASHFQAEHYEEAIAAAQKALALDPQSVQMIKLISVAFSRLGDETKAVEYQEKLKNFSAAEFSAEELYNMGVAEANKGNDAEAAKYFEKAVLSKPDFALGHYYLGLCYFRLNNLPGAKAELEKYLSLEPEGSNAKTARAILASIGGPCLHF